MTLNPLSSPDDRAALGKLSYSDRSLVARVRDGDELAATALYERYAHRVFELVDSKLGAQLRATTEPEDIVQSVFKSMFRGVQAGHYMAPPGSTLWNLLAVIAVNKLRRKATYQAAQRRDSQRSEVLETEDNALAVDESAADFLALCVRETVGLLRPLDREVLSMRIQGHSIDEISNAIGRSLRTVERSLQRCREQLAELLLDDN